MSLIATEPLEKVMTTTQTQVLLQDRDDRRNANRTSGVDYYTEVAIRELHYPQQFVPSLMDRHHVWFAQFGWR